MDVTPDLSSIKINHFKPSFLRIRILHKGLALVLIPLIINCVWIFMLNDALSRNQELLEQERYQSRLLFLMNSAIVEYGVIVGSAMNFLAIQREDYRTKARLHLNIFKQRLNTLSQTTANDPENHKWVEGLQKDLDSPFSIIETFKPSNNSSDYFKVLSSIKSFRVFSQDAGARNQLMLDILNSKGEELEKMRERDKHASAKVRTIVYTGLVLNFVVALIMLFLFIRNITSRLTILVDNANRLPKNLSLSSTVGGQDELSELDLALHETGKQLTEATEFRRTLTQMLAHDLRSPLTSSLIAIDLLERSDRETLSDSGHRQITSISKGLNQLLALINDLLLMESLEVGKLAIELSPENLKELILTAIETVSPLAQVKQIEIISKADRNYLLVDRGRVLQVLVNLLSNAIKFSPVRSQIIVNTEFSESFVKITISDQGVGIERSETNQVFQKFYQTDEGKKVGGSGLGLAISKLIVESHGGKIGVDSKFGNGSTFWLTLPVKPDEDDGQ